MLSLFNGTGRQVSVVKLDGLQVCLTNFELFVLFFYCSKFADETVEKPVTLEHNQSVPLKGPPERQTAGRLSVIQDQAFKKRQVFTVKVKPIFIFFAFKIKIRHFQVGDVTKAVNISRTWKRVYELGRSPYQSWPIQMLCDAHVKNDRRRITLSSIVRVFNNTTFPLVVVDVNSPESKSSTRVARVDVNQEYYIPIDVAYKHSEALVFIAIEE